MVRELIWTTAFSRAAAKYLKKHATAEDDISAALTLLSQDAFDARLKTHKLKGNRTGIWASSAGYDLRILFEIVEDEGRECVMLLAIGTHDEVY